MSEKENLQVDNWKQVCKAAGCEEKSRTKGHCSRHYQQIRHHGRLTPEREYGKRGIYCQVENCQEPQTAKGHCYRHYQQIRRYGQLTPERERIYGRTDCQVPDCQERHSARGYCKRHYMSQHYLPRIARRLVGSQAQV